MLSQQTIFEIAFLGITFYTSLFLSLILVPLSSRLAIYFNIFDHPDPRKIHAVPVPRLGGLAIALSLLASTLITIKLAPHTKAFLLGAGIVIVTGLLDDKFRLSSRSKFTGQILASLAFMSGGFELQTFGNLLGTGNLELGFLAPLVTIFCMVGVMNALNLSDGLDGLAGGLGVIAALFLAAAAYDHQAWYWASISLILLGVLLGFLRFNHFPAKLFMGDTGSLLIGYTLAAVAIGLTRPDSGAAAVEPISIAIILGLPIFDTLWVMGRRIRLGKNPFKPDKTHLHHRLMQLGVSHAGVVTIIYGIMLLLGFWAFLLQHLPDWQQFYLTLVFFTGLYWTLGRLEKKQIHLGRLLDSVRIIKPHSGSLVSRRLEAVFSRLPLLIFGMLFVPVAFVSPLPRLLGFLSFAAALFILMLYPWKTRKRRLPIAHGLVYAGCFLLLLLYNLTPGSPAWMFPFLSLCSLLAFGWVLIKVAITREDPILYPSSFDILLMLFSWFIPIVLIPSFSLGPEIQMATILICVQTMPLLCLTKLTVRRHPRRNKALASTFIFFFLTIGILSLL